MLVIHKSIEVAPNTPDHFKTTPCIMLKYIFDNPIIFIITGRPNIVIHKSIEEQRQELELLLEKISSKESNP